ncbi:ORF029 [Saltwater crocodilepox virus]|nr:hypothetical protein [Saltwater crocodilepox virus]AVD69366.1 hypothetical protein [Saltwater crocodilepox virus]QGT46468.1 ORF029 [Saltwater crocodilepox virus]QGT46684.1 ORF029 [Saltwater crocodilepox virus]QGT46901.1 ORF029 [Saltwater crocodilepox virus]
MRAVHGGLHHVLAHGAAGFLARVELAAQVEHPVAQKLVQRGRQHVDLLAVGGEDRAELRDQDHELLPVFHLADAVHRAQNVVDRAEDGQALGARQVEVRPVLHLMLQIAVEGAREIADAQTAALLLGEVEVPPAVAVGVAGDQVGPGQRPLGQVLRQEAHLGLVRLGDRRAPARIARAKADPPQKALGKFAQAGHRGIRDGATRGSERKKPGLGPRC